MLGYCKMLVVTLKEISMKKYFILFAVLVVVCTISYANRGGFENTCNPTKISEALKLPHNSYAKVQGKIVKQLTSDEYLFEDSTGTMTIEIDADKWMGQTVKPGDTVEITGEIEKKLNSTKIDVDTIKKLN